MKDKIKKIAGFYKFENQSRQLSEECAELIQAVNKYQRYSSRCSSEPIEYDWKYYQNVVEVIYRYHTVASAFPKLPALSFSRLRRQLPPQGA